MRFRKIALALFACLALGAFAANAAQAAQWTVGTTENQTTAGTTVTKEGVNCSRHGTTELILHSTVTGIPITLKATQIDCVEFFIETGAGDSGAFSSGKLRFTGVTVEPSTCSVPGGTLTSNALKGHIDMDTKVKESTAVIGTLFPASGTVIVEVPLEGASCPFAGITAPVKGTVCGETVHTNAGGSAFEGERTGTLTKVHTMLFGSAQQTTGECALTLGTAPAVFTGAVDSVLNGAVSVGNKEKPYGED